MSSPDYLNQKALRQFIKRALKEDVGPGDFSAMGSIPEGAQAKAELRIKDDGIIAGIEMAGAIYAFADPSLQVATFLKDGENISRGDIAFEVLGNARSILSTERFVLNCMQRMSGIATKTFALAQLIKGYKAKLLDTRKTTPNFRICEKWAVKIGGGENHRFGLYDMVMLKDNHIDYAGGIKQAITSTVAYLRENNLQLKIEVETRSLDEVMQVLEIERVDIIMLDNMSTDEMKEAVHIIGDKCLIEASGGITEKTIVDVAACDVDYISVGALTHSFRSLDMSLKAVKV